MEYSMCVLANIICVRCVINLMWENWLACIQHLDIYKCVKIMLSNLNCMKMLEREWENREFGKIPPGSG